MAHLPNIRIVGDIKNHTQEDGFDFGFTTLHAFLCVRSSRSVCCLYTSFDICIWMVSLKTELGGFCRHPHSYQEYPRIPLQDNPQPENSSMALGFPEAQPMVRWIGIGPRRLGRKA